MINFKLAPESIAWKEHVKSFVKANVIPRTDLDQHGHFPMDLYQKAFDAGVMTTSIPAVYGGQGKSFIETLLAVEECAYGDLGFTTSAFVSRLALGPLLLFGTENQKQQWLNPLTQKLGFASFGFTEPAGSTNLGTRPATTEFEAVDGGFKIRGEKSTISNASYAQFFTVFARQSDQSRGFSCFIVPGNAKGIELTPPLKKMGQRAGDTAGVKFFDTFVPTENLIGKIGQGPQVALMSLRSSRIGVGAMALGVSRRARDLAKIHCHNRKTGGGQPIIFEQDIQFKFATMEAKIDMLRAYLYNAAWELENGNHGTKYSSGLKLLSAQIACDITNECLELHGGAGYLEENTIEKLVRDTKLLQIYEGTEAVQKLLIADSAIRLSSDLRGPIPQSSGGNS
jgi:acyl-CoA dehydrogenase